MCDVSMDSHVSHCDVITEQEHNMKTITKEGSG
jgi:hypothetical protein